MSIVKGNRWRRKCEVFLGGLGFNVTVRGLGFAGDDLRARLGLLDLSVECKDHNRYSLSEWVTQAEENAEGGIPVVFAHRRGKADPEAGYVVMSGAAFARLVSGLARDDIVLDNDITM
jgi:hypothetical protein